MLRGPVAEAPEVVEESVRVWVAGLSRLRTEVVESDQRAGSVTVVDGDRWWMFDPERGVLRHDGGDDTTVGTYDVETFLDPSVLIPHLDFAMIDTGEADGRACWVVDATPRKTLHESRYVALTLPSGADWYRLWIDQERGTALRIESSWRGEPFIVRYVTGVVFDAPLADGLFEYRPPAGAPVFTTQDEPDVRQVSIEEAARVAPFTVLFPVVFPDGMTMRVSFHPGGGIFASKPTVKLSAWDEHHHRGIHIVETATNDDWEDGLEWRPVEHKGVRYMACDLTDERMVRLDLHGTRARLSGPFELPVLFDVAHSLEPAPGTPRT
jgi:outer membrane lipoprotein-sorting protein